MGPECSNYHKGSGLCIIADIKVSNHIVNSVSHHIFKKYFRPNEIILTFSVSLELHEIAKLNMADVT